MTSPKIRPADAIGRIYETIAADFDRVRGRGLMERAYLDALTDGLEPGAEILDLGCGSSEPIARYLLEHGYRLTGVDAAEGMIDLCNRRFPSSTWIVGDMQSLDLGVRMQRLSPGTVSFISHPSGAEIDVSDIPQAPRRRRPIAVHLGSKCWGIDRPSLRARTL